VGGGQALRDITAGALQKFFWQNIIRRFGVPKEVIVDNGKKIDCATFRAFCDQLGMKLCFASAYHLQSNGAVELANGTIFTSIKKNITEQPKGKWVDELLRSFGYTTRSNQGL
jgi:transposase InsO family protein